ncbi:cyclase family protein [Cryobacterium psychrophilum]|uniref:Cyclase family protein n=1 Tax=Cryobacterium psychrophilum TaxID=41988 RepID=A0A4Y8KQN6_9MICO|nr:cyclase family protein [Cryobacterium psychrophilum]TDW29406.1 kynurenine formamidase [Cryobacterium psychrophilum]TFD81451.1 cyclase family protein [Cryobacterium psychrophilum]
MRINKVVDLSLVINAETQTYPGDPEARFLVHSTIERDGFNLLSVSMGSQTGTHVDAPYHFDEAAPKIDEIPLDRFVGRGVIVDARGLGARGVITWEHISPLADQLEPGVIVLLHTGWSEHYGTPTYFENPYLDADACRRMIALGVRTFGIDAINIDETPDDEHPGVGFPVHHLIADVGGVISENLTNVAAIDFGEPLISLLPIAFEAADGAPVRAVALNLES